MSSTTDNEMEQIELEHTHTHSIKAHTEQAHTLKRNHRDNCNCVNNFRASNFGKSFHQHFASGFDFIMTAQLGKVAPNCQSFYLLCSLSFPSLPLSTGANELLANNKSSPAVARRCLRVCLHQIKHDQAGIGALRRGCHLGITISYSYLTHTRTVPGHQYAAQGTINFSG